MKKWMLFSTMVAVVSIAAWGCGGKKESTENKEKTHDHGKVTKVAFKTTDELACLKCGHGLLKSEKDVHKCEDHHACEKCKLHEDSPLCCKIEAGDAKLVCLGCGQIAGSENCCKEDATVCQKCGFHEKSTLCCKVVKAGFEAPATDTDAYKKDGDKKDADTDSKDTDAKDTDAKDTDAKDTDAKDTDAKDTDAKDTDAKDTDAKDTDVKTTESKDTDVKDADKKTETDATKSEPTKTDADK